MANALERIKSSIEKVIPKVRVTHREGVGKLQIAVPGAEIKLEVNLVNRGTLTEPKNMPLSEKAQNDFEVFCAMPVVPFGQLFGGKIIAALDRQHPRDLFDVKYLLQNEGFSDRVKEGFLLLLLCSDKPINELFTPNFKDQQLAIRNHFVGMTDEPFTYGEYEATRKALLKVIGEALNDQDKNFILSVKNLTPDWTIYDFSRFPAISWKLQNLQKLKDKNPDKHRELYTILEKKLTDLS